MQVPGNFVVKEILPQESLFFNLVIFNFREAKIFC